LEALEPLAGIAAGCNRSRRPDVGPTPAVSSAAAIGSTVTRPVFRGLK